VSHDIDEAFRFCDRIAVVGEGRIREIGPTQQIVSQPGTLDTIKLSGCKNTSAARKVGPGLVEATDWGITLATTNPIPDGLAYVGVRAFFIQRVDDPETFEGMPENIIPCVVDRISDSRFERTVMVKAVGRESFAQRIQWKVDKLAVPREQLPEKGFLSGANNREEHRYLLGIVQQTDFLHVHPLLHFGMYPLLAILNFIEHAFQVADEKSCGSRWRLYPCMAHHIQYALVTLMTNTRNHRQREISHILCKCQCVEA
jgi:hypothetical protein